MVVEDSRCVYESVAVEYLHVERVHERQRYAILENTFYREHILGRKRAGACRHVCAAREATGQKGKRKKEKFCVAREQDKKKRKKENKTNICVAREGAGRGRSREREEQGGWSRERESRKWH